MKPALLTAIILTHNSELSLRKVLTPLHDWVNRIVVVDSFSNDRTVEIAKSAGCEVVQHVFENYAAQRNWAQEYANISKDSWVLHLDADEIIDDELRESVVSAIQSPKADGYLIRRLTYFYGYPIRYGHMNPSWHLRLFRAGVGRCEDRFYDQHFVMDGPSSKLSGFIHDRQNVDVHRWTDAHNKWSLAEALEVSSIELENHCQAKRRLKPSLAGDERMKKRWYKQHVYYKLPLLVRPFMLFVYSYFIRLGFLDGKAGFVYHILQVFWFRFLVDAKIWSMKKSSQGHFGGSQKVCN
jgi:glycosyltransferase involved in cell wall biosynthesis